MPDRHTAGRHGASGQRGSVATDPQPFNRVGSARYGRASLALFLAGFASFSLLYCPQPLLPTLTRAFAIGPAASSLAVSLCTGFLAPSIIIAASVSDRWGRRATMVGSMLLAATFNIGTAAAPSWPLLLALRAGEGIMLGGVPAIAMTYLAEETEPDGLGLAMGLYVGATAVGGMGGRVITGFVADLAGWRVALGVIGVIGLCAALAAALLLPPSRHFTRRRVDPRSQASAFAAALRQPALVGIYGIAFLMMGGFVAVYNYVGFRLEQEPYSLTPSQEGLIFTLYLVGTLGSTIAGSLADRLGKGVVMSGAVLIVLGGLAATLAAPLGAVVLGIGLITFGFFGAHAVASGSVGSLAGGTKGQAASLYLLSYYAGSSLLGTAGGWFWTIGGWWAVAGFVAALFGLALGLCIVVSGSLRRRVAT